MKGSLLAGACLLCFTSGCEKPELRNGAQLFDYYCAGCHGTDGNGKFLKGVPSLQDRSYSVTRLRSIMRGHRRPRGDDTRMPVFDDLSAGEVNKIAAHIKREFKKPDSPR